MKWLIASDIHGSAKYCKMLMDRFAEEKADRMLILGDLLYHGPRNDLPDEYNPKLVIEMLNSAKERLVCVRGNCDGEVDQMVLSFPIMAEYAVIDMGGTIVYATHGHHFNEEHPLPMPGGCVLLCGHTHVPKSVRHDRFTYMNPGSVSIPKDNSRHSYMVWEDGFIWKDLQTGNPYSL